MSTLTLAEAATNFLAHKKIAVAGVSRTDNNLPANLIYRKLREAGYEVYALNPQAAGVGGMVEGDVAYGELGSLPTAVEGVVIATPPSSTMSILADCVAHGVRDVWIHKSLDGGSLPPEAINYAREQKLNLIPGGCPMMFCAPVDIAHKCMRWLLHWTGGIPREVAQSL
jgi:uncharacterized protein